MEDFKLQLTFEPSSDDPPISSPEYQEHLRVFVEALDEQGIEVSSRRQLQESAANSGWAFGVFTFVVSTLGPVAIVQLRKAVETFIKAREGRKLKVKVGNLTVEGTASEVAKLITPEQITKMLDVQNRSPEKILHD